MQSRRIRLEVRRNGILEIEEDLIRSEPGCLLQHPAIRARHG
jgi:hypothetical protein